MIMKISNFENDIIISDGYVRVLEIEDKALFANIVHSIYSLCYNEESKEYIVLLDEKREIDFVKDVYFVSDILNIDFNDRKTLNKLYAKMGTMIDLDMKEQLDTHCKHTLNLINTVLIETPFEFNYRSELEIEDLFKLYGFKLCTQEQSFMEKVFCLIDLISLLDLCKVLVFCNMKSFFINEQIEEIYKYITYNKLHVLLIEGTLAEENLMFEKKVRIDDSFEDYEIQ